MNDFIIQCRGLTKNYGTKTALEQGNGDRLCTLLAEGRICKEKVDAE